MYARPLLDSVKKDSPVKLCRQPVNPDQAKNTQQSDDAPKPTFPSQFPLPQRTRVSLLGDSLAACWDQGAQRNPKDLCLVVRVSLAFFSWSEYLE